MEKHAELSDDEFEKQFRTCALSPADFSHEAHLRLAWIHITRDGIEQAEQNIQSQLKKFVEAAGAADKYNTTVTIAACRAVHHFIGKSTSTRFNDFIAEFPRLKNDFKALIGSHYGVDIFTDVKAKREFLEPDLLPFDS